MKSFSKSLILSTCTGLACLTAPAAVSQSTANGPVYQDKLIDLAGVLGRIHSIRVLCNGQSDQYWRNYMRNLLELEAPSPGYLRSRMVDNFNSSYTEEQAAQGSCSVSATRAETTLSERGRQISDSLASLASGVTP